MKLQRTLRVASVLLLLLAGFLFQETWTLAGVTGNIAGTVTRWPGLRLAGVQVEAVSPSQTRADHDRTLGVICTILSLAPDTYTLELSQIRDTSLRSIPGVVVFADQTQQVSYMVGKTTPNYRARDVASGLLARQVGRRRRPVQR